jgi:hypothetical protein
MDGLAMVCRWWLLVVVLEFEWCGRIDAPIQPTSVRCLSRSAIVIGDELSSVRVDALIQPTDVKFS